MTPLATKFAKELLLPERKRTCLDDAGVLTDFGPELHCFDISAIAEACYRGAIKSENMPDTLALLGDAFLPSPITWLEDAEGTAFILQRVGDGRFCLRQAGTFKGRLSSCPIAIFGRNAAGELDLQVTSRARHEGGVSPFVLSYCLFCVLVLNAINNAAVTDTVARISHKGRIRELKARGVDTRNLQYWSEVTLRPHIARSGSPTGEGASKCFHFVRSHLRHITEARTTVVKAHWRGDIALGTKRTDYKADGSLVGSAAICRR